MKVPEEIREEWEQITLGAIDVIPEEGMLERIKDARGKKKALRIKYGADPSAPDIHLGHTVPIRKLRQFQDFGHQIIFIIGDFTARIGDPTGRSETRKRLTPEEVEANAQTYLEQIFKILDPEKTRVAYNSSWFDKMTFTDVIELGAKYTVARMLERDDFKKRFAGERPIFIHEFMYPLAQGWDSVEIRSDVEIGGTDQTFNMLVAREIQKQSGMIPQCVLTLPLLVGTDGVNKMSKSLGNYIGITESPKEIFGKTMSIPDDVMMDYYRLVLGFTKDETDALQREMEKGDAHPRDLKARLGRKIVTLYHSETAAKDAEDEFNRIFRKGQTPDEMKEMTLATSGKGLPLFQVLTKTRMASSNREARRLITGGGVSVDNEKIEVPEKQIDPGIYVIKVGKRRFIKVDLK